MSLLLTLKRFHILFWCFHCWLSASKCRLGVWQAPKYASDEFLSRHKLKFYFQRTVKNIKKKERKKERKKEWVRFKNHINKP